MNECCEYCRLALTFPHFSTGKSEFYEKCFDVGVGGGGGGGGGGKAVFSPCPPTSKYKSMLSKLIFRLFKQHVFFNCVNWLNIM